MRILSQTDQRVRLLYDGSVVEFTGEQWQRMMVACRRSPVPIEFLVDHLRYAYLQGCAKELESELTRFEQRYPEAPCPTNT